MKTFAFAAALCAAFFAPKHVAAQLYNTVPLPPAGGAANFSLTPGAQLIGDVFKPIWNGPICFVEGIFVDTGGANRNFVIVVSFYNNECLGCPAARSFGYNITLPPLPIPPDPAVYRIRFQIAAPGFTYMPDPVPNNWVGVSFHVSPPGVVPPYPPSPCPLGVAPTLVPAFGAFPPTVGTEVIGISADIQPQDCCLNTGLNLRVPPKVPSCFGTEWFTPRNLLVTLLECPPPPSPTSALRGPVINNPFDPSDDVTIELLDMRAIQLKEFINLTDVDLMKS